MSILCFCMSSWVIQWVAWKQLDPFGSALCDLLGGAKAVLSPRLTVFVCWSKCSWAFCLMPRELWTCPICLWTDIIAALVHLWPFQMALQYACTNWCSAESSRKGALSLNSFLFSDFLFHGQRLPLSLRTSALVSPTQDLPGSASVSPSCKLQAGSWGNDRAQYCFLRLPS